MLEYSRTMHKMADEEDLVPGLGHVTIQGGVFAGEFKAREVSAVLLVQGEGVCLGVQPY